MASSLALDERALILAPPQLAADTARLLATVGIESLCAHDIANLHDCLIEGAALAIIAEQVQAIEDDIDDALKAVEDRVQAAEKTFQDAEKKLAQVQDPIRAGAGRASGSACRERPGCRRR